MSDAATHFMLPVSCGLVGHGGDTSSGREPIRAESTGVGDMHNCEGKRERNTCYQRLRAGAGEGASAQAWV